MASRKKKSVTVENLIELLLEYDTVHGTYPEHEREGRSVGLFILHALRFPFEEAQSRLGPLDDYCRGFVSRDEYEENKPKTFRVP